MDVYGHPSSTDAEDLAAKLDAMWRDSQTDKRRTGRTLRPANRLVPQAVSDFT